jgi:thioredoxin-dependent peroxiredoxin
VIEPGATAPDFELPDQDGRPVRLSFRAQPVVLCVSPDPVDAVKRFHDKQGLNFTLLADEDHSVADSYGVWAEKSMYGRTYWGVLRATFIIDPDGNVAHVIPKVSPKTHDEQALAALADLREAA